MKYEILFCVALPSESKGRLEKFGYPVLYTGVGKLNAAICLHREISNFHERRIYPKLIINFGTVGSGSIPEASLVMVKRFVQRDMLCEPLAPKYHTPFDPTGADGPIDLLSFTNRLPKVSCGTGDSFVNSDILKMSTGPNLPYDVVDMEGFALAKVCQAIQIPLISIKYVTDTGDTSDWRANLDSASKAFSAEASELILELNL